MWKPLLPQTMNTRSRYGLFALLQRSHHIVLVSIMASCVLAWFNREFVPWVYPDIVEFVNNTLHISVRKQSVKMCMSNLGHPNQIIFWVGICATTTLGESMVVIKAVLLLAHLNSFVWFGSTTRCPCLIVVVFSVLHFSQRRKTTTRKLLVPRAMKS